MPASNKLWPLLKRQHESAHWQRTVAQVAVSALIWFHITHCVKLPAPTVYSALINNLLPQATQGTIRRFNHAYVHAMRQVSVQVEAKPQDFLPESGGNA